jgi:hypothetical protein
MPYNSMPACQLVSGLVCLACPSLGIILTCYQVLGPFYLLVTDEDELAGTS